MATTMLARTLASISQRSVIPRVVTGVRHYCEKPIPFYDPAAGKEGKLSGNYHVYKQGTNLWHYYYYYCNLFLKIIIRLD